jgi:protein-disulfide isomerase
VISDFQCPSCRQAAFQLPLLLQEYQHRVRLYFINYPLDRKVNPYIPKTIHPQSGLAARAAVCAQNRLEFHEFHDDLFRNQDKLSMPHILNLAEKRPWDIKDFASCLFSQESYSALQEQLNIAATYHIVGTPAVIINGRQADYWFRPDILRAIMSREMDSLY